MDEQQMRDECAKIQSEWQIGGLAGGMYEDFAVELAKRVQAAERERCAKLCDDIHARHIAEYGDYIGETYAAQCARAIRA